jgi:hypothetical protein
VAIGFQNGRALHLVFSAAVLVVVDQELMVAILDRTGWFSSEALTLSAANCCN